MFSYDDVPRVHAGPGSQAAPIQRCLFVGDVHAEDVRLKTALSLGRDAGVDARICVGDVADGEGDLAMTMALLDGGRVLTVRGNHDRWFVADEHRDVPHASSRKKHAAAIDAMALWPTAIELATAMGPVLLCHGIGDDDMGKVKAHTTDAELAASAAWQGLRASSYRTMLGGHTHEPFARVVDGVLVLNAGTLKRDESPAVCILDFQAKTLDVHDLADPKKPVLRTTLRW